MVNSRKRQNRSAAGRREQYDRAHARVAQTLIKGFMALDHRGCKRTKLGDALLLLLATQQPADHGADNSKLFADSQPWQWQWWQQPEAPWPQWPPPCPQQEQESLVESVQANTSTPVAAAARSPLGPAAEDLESNWSFSCTSVAPDGRFCRMTSVSSQEDTAAQEALRPPAPSKVKEVGDSREAATTTALATAGVPPVNLSTSSPLAETANDASLGKGLGDRVEAEVTAAALATPAAVQQASLSKASPPLVTATVKLSDGKTEDSRGRAGATTTALTAVEVPQVSPSTPSSPLPDKWTTLGDNFGKRSTVAETSRYHELISEQCEAHRRKGPFSEEDAQRYQSLLEFAAEHKRTLLRREARAARQRQRQEQPPDGRPEQSAESKRAG